MDEKDNSILFTSEDGSEIRFTVISETKLNGKKAQYMENIHNGDNIEIYWEEIQRP